MPPHLLTRLFPRLAYWNDSRAFTCTTQLQVNVAPEALPSATDSLPAMPEALCVAPEALYAAVSPPSPFNLSHTQEKSQHTGSGDLCDPGPAA